MRGSAGLLLVCCTGSEPRREVPSAEGLAEPSALGWVSEVASDPEAFAALTRDPEARAGWIAMHAHDYREAIARFSGEPVGRARAELALGVFYQDLSRLSGLVDEQLFTSWSSRGGLPPGGDAPMVAALAASCSGGAADGWAKQIALGPDGALGAAIAEGRSPFEAEADGPYGRRMAIHRQVRSTGDPTPLMAAAAVPMASIQESGFVRSYWDPCVYRTLADLWLDRAASDAQEGPTIADPQEVRPLDRERWRNLVRLTGPEAGLGARFLAAWPTAADLQASVEVADGPGSFGWPTPSLERLGVGAPSPAAPEAPPRDDPEAARDEVRILDAGLDGIHKQLADEADPEGLAVMADLGLLRRFRQEWLTVRARQALEAREPRRALVYLELARDVGARTVGPENSPSLFALTAEARLKLGYTREALDALHLLVGPHPEIFGLVEATGDLAVLQGIDRQGDSKED